MMHPVFALTQLALCASTAHAFFPYTPKWLEERISKKPRDITSSVEGIQGRDGLTLNIKQRNAKPEIVTPKQIADEASRLAAKYDAREISTDDGLTRRQNNYEILEADGTDEEDATGVHQDGTDYSYFVSVGLGSDAKELHLLIDTGAGSSWVMGSDCTTDACNLHDSFGPDDSDTYDASEEEFTITYGTGRVKGLLVTDTLSVAGLKLSYKLGVASETSKDFVNFAFDGILGLSMNDGANDNFLESIAEADLVDASMFAVSLHRAADGANDGEIKFGGVNEDKFTGDISYTSTNKDNGDWAIEIEDMSYDGQKAGVGGVSAYIDTGTTFIFGPKELVKSLHSVIPGAESADGVSYKVPCDSEGPLAFTFSGVDYAVSPKDWISPQNSAGKCTSNIYGQEVVSGSWLLGAAFIKNVYAVFDKDEKRIGFAQRADESSAPTTSTASTSSAVATETSESTSTEDDSSTLLTTTFTTSSSSPTEPSVGLGQESIESDSSATAEETSEPTNGPDADADADADSNSSGQLAIPKALLAVFLGLLYGLLM